MNSHASESDKVMLSGFPSELGGDGYFDHATRELCKGRTEVDAIAAQGANDTSKQGHSVDTCSGNKVVPFNSEIS